METTSIYNQNSQTGEFTEPRGKGAELIVCYIQLFESRAERKLGREGGEVAG